MSGPHLQKDLLTGRWVVQVDWSQDGAELHLSEAVFEAGRRVAVVVPPAPVFDKRARVERAQGGEGAAQLMSGAGAHEVVIETPLAGPRFAELQEDHVAEILGTWRERFDALKDDRRFRQLLVVKAEGRRAGARADRAHSEIFALSFVPDEHRQRLVQMHGHQRRTGSCLLCAEAQRARGSQLLVAESFQFFAHVPEAARRPFELRIQPKGHHGDFVHTSPEGLLDLARLLLEVLGKMDAALERPAYRLILFNAPMDAGADPGAFHWHLELLPALDLPSALGGVVDCNPIAPAEAARVLRG